MFDYSKFQDSLFSITEETFTTSALDLFCFQFAENPVYGAFCRQLGKSPENVHTLTEIPFLPIEFFKTQKVITGIWDEKKIFKSSGTTLQQRSRHYVRDEAFYHRIAVHIFEAAYGPLADIQILALLPSYLEQGDSSLISMVDHFISKSAKGSGYMLNKSIPIDNPSQQKRLLIGVSYALLDLCEQQMRFNDPELLVMETGGMKGRRKEMIKEELHQTLKEGLGVREIHSEYGMTELTSQAYGVNGTFRLPPWSKALIRDINDPFLYLSHEKNGGLNIIDLANVHSCAFIETQDLGKVIDNDQFMILGRFDNSDIRGCNLLI